MNKDYKGLLKLLKYHKVKYVIIGNYAYSCYVEPRSTIDLDILIESTRENAEKMVKVLEDFDFKPENLKWRYFAEKGNKIQLGHEPLIIDILTSIPGVSWSEIWECRESVLILTSASLVWTKASHQSSTESHAW